MPTTSPQIRCYFMLQNLNAYLDESKCFFRFYWRPLKWQTRAVYGCMATGQSP